MQITRSLTALLLTGSLLAACTPTVPPTDTPSTGSGSVSSDAPLTASVPAYVIEEDFGNVYNIDYLENHIPEGTARDLLRENGFVVIPGYHNEYFGFYESTRYANDPVFVTSDAMLHTYHLLFNHLLEKTEEDKLSALVSSMTDKMLAEATAQHNALKGTDWENAAKRNLGFFAVAKKLIDPSYTFPAIIKAEAEQELALIDAHAGTAESPVMNIGGPFNKEVQTPWGMLRPGALEEDYSQYVPRGHYDRTDKLKNYFRAMMWYGRLTFRFRNPDEVKSALLVTKALENETARAEWERVYEVTAFFVGASDDLTYAQMDDVMNEVYGATDIKGLTADAGKLQEFMQKTNDLPGPKINSMPIFFAPVNPDREQQIKGFRFMGQRFTLDSEILQRLVCRDVGTNTGEDICGAGVPGSRMLPKGLDVAAAFGSGEAYELLDEMGETSYKNYPRNMTELRAYVAGIDEQTWTQNLYWGWLYAIKPLVQVPGQGYPLFMQNEAWLRKQLQTFLGSWTELRHDTILYVKQSYAELGGGPPPEKDDRGYVEPVPAVFGRLHTLARMTREGLDSRGLLPDSQRDNLSRMEALSASLETIARKELANEKITDEEYELIRSFGGQLEHLWYEINREKMEASGMTQIDYLIANPAAIVADVATDPGGQVLEEATGYVNEIYVLVPVEGRLKLLGGAVYSYYEFPWPIGDRLTDDKWREMVRSDSMDPPAQPAWTDSFTAR